MPLVRRWSLLLVLLVAAGLPLWAATVTENRAFDAAHSKLTAGFYQQAEADFAEFLQKFTNSPLVPEAILCQAEARIKLTNYAGALELLAAHKDQAGKRADEYLFWQAEALSQKGELQSSANLFGQLARDFSSSPRCLEAAIREATDRAALSDWPRVLEGLSQTNGVYQKAIKAGTTSEMIARGNLLLSEALFRRGDYGMAEQELASFTNAVPSPQLNWKREYLHCRLLAATGRPEAALQSVTNLLTLAGTSQPQLGAESLALHAELLEQLGRPAEAVPVYQRNLTPNVSPIRQRQALGKVSEILLAQNKVSEAASIIEKFLAQCSTAECADQALLTLGELRLRQEQETPQTAAILVTSTNAPGVTNRLQQALAAFQNFTNKYPQSPFFGKAQLDLGWCYWLEGKRTEAEAVSRPGGESVVLLKQALGKWSDAEAVLRAAVQKLPPSVDLAVAWFKLGDTQFKMCDTRAKLGDPGISQTNYLPALASYGQVIEKFGSMAEVTNTLFEPALYQMIRAGLAVGDLGAVTNALGKILCWFPNGFHTDRAVLLAGQEVARRDPGAARRLFSDVAKRAPDPPLRAELELAIARTHEQEGHWTEAIAQYGDSMPLFTNYDTRARAEFSIARACARAGQETNAFTFFTNFIAHFPTNEFGPLAQWWVAGYYARNGAGEAAEKGYQFVYQNTNWPTTNVSYQARMMAGRLAFNRQGWDDAKRYFTALVNNTNCPANLRAQALIALGDTLVSQDSTNKLDDCKEALNAYSRVADLWPSNEIAALAWGAKANCLLQCAPISSNYLDVSNAFQQVIDAPRADVKARSIATVGLGVALEKLAELKTGDEQNALYNLALGFYGDVFYGKVLRGGEKPDLFWTREAGLKAGRLAENLKLRRQAVNVYQHLQEDIFPTSRLEERINNLKAQDQESVQK